MLSTNLACFHPRSKQHQYCQLQFIDSMTFLLFKRKSDESFYNVSTNFQSTEFFFHALFLVFFRVTYFYLHDIISTYKVLETKVVTIIFLIRRKPSANSRPQFLLLLLLLPNHFHFLILFAIFLIFFLVLTYPNLPKLAQTYPNLPKLAQTCPDLPKLAQTCLNLP